MSDGDGPGASEITSARCQAVELLMSRPGSLQPPASHCISPTTPSIMSSLRIARAALRVRPTAIARPLQRRGYAEASSDKIKLSLALPHSVRIHDCLSMRPDQLLSLHCCGLKLTTCARSLSTGPRMCTSPLTRPTPRKPRTKTNQSSAASRSTSLRKPARWVSWQTTCRRLNN
jgi:hypothetical protein